MKTLVTILSFILIFNCQNLSSQIAANVVVSEFATRGQSSAFDEFIELYNPTANDVDISNWKFQYKSATGSTWIDQATLPAGSIMKAHGFFLHTNNGYSGAVPADVKWGSNGIADNGNIRIINATAVEVDRVGYGSGNDPKGSAAPNHGTTGNGNSIERKASASSTAASLTTGGAEEKSGNGYNSNNNTNDFIIQTNGRNPQNSTSPIEPKSADGAGSAYCVTKVVKAGSIIDVVIVFKPGPTDPVSAMKIVPPKEFTWSKNISDVAVDPNMTASVSIVNDSVFFSGVAITGDSTRILLKSFTTPSGTALHTFRFFTRGISKLLEIQSSPQLLVIGAPIPIIEAKENDVNGVPIKLSQYVTVNGYVTVANEFGNPTYIQDASGGLAVFDQTFVQAVTIGDEVTLTGRMDQFNGLTELVDVIIDSKPSTGNVVVPTNVTISDLLNDGANGNEQYEAMLVRINNVSVNTGAWTVSGSGTNYRLTSGSDAIDIRVDNNVDYAGQPAPGGAFDVIGVVSQFKSTSPYIGAYQLMPRTKSDILSIGPRITSVPIESAIKPNSVMISWNTQSPGSSFIRFGKTKAYEFGTGGQDENVTVHQVPLNGLEPATIYHAQAFSVAAGDTSFAPNLIFSSASRTSSGAMNPFFNKSIDTLLAVNASAQGNVNLPSKLLSRIASAKYSIDVSLYSLSGSPGSAIATALLDAKARGVPIRMIMEQDNTNSAAVNQLRNSFPFITDTYDAVNAGAGLMHNKFFIIDARDRSSDTDDWVITGSWNPTETGSFDDAQNYIEIQDQALAHAYTAEFEEMWGSSTSAPDQSKTRFGARKTDNTPHRFNINGAPVELYFSPSDRTTSKILEAFSNSTSSINFCLLTFTRSDLANTMKTKQASGVQVRGVMDNNADTGTQYSFLLTNGIDVHLKPSSITGLLHHKYAIVDAEKYNANTAVITGSHNWSNAAENSNNENTLIIHDGRVANLYLQEFGKRYTEAGGTGKIITNIASAFGGRSQADFYLGQNYPNPFREMTIVDYRLSNDESDDTPGVSFKVYDVLGREVLDLTNQISRNSHITIRHSQLPARGIYFYRLITPLTAQTRTMIFS